ncbi:MULTISPECIES: DUF4156 domain-containing protein [Erwinia]|uniref:DUF4156 domain-containing protein n=1 Tax=Erwinia TaxID=551 RepID=UPI0005539770|nr:MULTISPECIES: DUF4156 domain-containing protein [Erwinia]
MRINVLLVGAAAAMLLAGCSSSKQLSSSGERVTFTDQQPAKECQLLGNVTGSQSNWLSGAGGAESSSLRGAANDLRNRAAEMGGNVIYGATSPTQNIWSGFAPLDSKMSGQVYKCP